MSEKITAFNIDTVVMRNLEIKDTVQKEARQFLSTVNNCGVQSKPQMGLAILKSYGLIQLPVNDSFWSGAIFVAEGKNVPVINTALPRANQYFAYWHEIYHIFFDKVGTDHFVETESTTDERKADYFASFVLMDGVMEYFSDLKNMEFLPKVFNCMSVFQSPYKAVLVSLYEEAIQNDNNNLKTLVKENFDRRFDNLPSVFRDLGLDDSLVCPSYVINCDRLKNKMNGRIEKEPDLDYHMDNVRYLESIIKEIKILMEDRNG